MLPRIAATIAVLERGRSGEDSVGRMTGATDPTHVAATGRPCPGRIRTGGSLVS